MENNHIWLQLFADGQAAAAPGETDAAAGHQDASTQPDLGQQTAARMTWEQVKADPEFSQKMQEMVRNRLKNAKNAQAALEKLTPALRTLSQAYGLAEETPDYDALTRAVTGDDRFYAQKAETLGVSVDIARKLSRLEQLEKENTFRQEDQALRSHFQNLWQQAQLLKQEMPEFDLGKELEDPAFVRLTAPNVGISLEDAYYTVHRKALQADAAAQTVVQISNAIRAGAMRPEENGAAGSPAVTTFDYRNASREARNALKKQIRQAAARGQKVYP